jgi:tRNA(Ile2) C34 agmatinyltransferase TiaS
MSKDHWKEHWTTRLKRQLEDRIADCNRLADQKLELHKEINSLKEQLRSICRKCGNTMDKRSNGDYHCDDCGHILFKGDKR